MTEIISSKQLKSIVPSVYIIIDGANLIQHTSMPRMLCKTDDIEIDYLKLKYSQINIEELFHTLLYLQGTALNLSGHQRIFIRTVDLKLIQIDQRMIIPPVFHDFRRMFYTFLNEGLIKAESGESILMKYVKNDIGNCVPPGLPRYSLYIKDEDEDDEETKITKVEEFTKNGPAVVYVHLNPENVSKDEVMQDYFCISNDHLSTASVLQRVIKSYEQQLNIW